MFIIYSLVKVQLLSRHPEEKDPPYVPSKVLMVQRVRCLKKKPYWDKNIMKTLGLDGVVS